MKRALVIVIAAIIALGSGVGVAILHRHPQKATATTTVSTSGTVTVTESTTVVVEEEDSRFVVDLGKCRAYDNISRELLWNSLSKEDRARTKAAGFSDAVSFPLKGMDDEEKITAIREEILRNPVYGDMVARGFTEVKLSDGTTTLSDINPWIEDFIAKSDKAYKNTTEIGKRGVEVWLEAKGDKYYVTDEYREYACGLATIIDRMVVVGYSSRKSVLHFPLNDAVKDYARRTEKGDKQEDKQAFVLQYVRKDGTKIFEIAFNMHDRRFELLGNYAKPAPTTTRRSGGTGGEPTTKQTPRTTRAPSTTKREPSTTKPATTKPHTTNPSTTKPPVTVTWPSITWPSVTFPTLPSTTKSTTTTTRYSKPTQEDPGHQGNAPVGAGSNQTGDGRGNYQPTAQRPPETTTRRVTTTARVTTTVATTASSGVNLDNATPPTTQVIPTVTDSHDTPSSNAGNNNGAFSMD